MAGAATVGAKTPVGNSACPAVMPTAPAVQFGSPTFGLLNSPRLASTGAVGFVLANGSMSSNQSGEGDIRGPDHQSSKRSLANLSYLVFHKQRSEERRVG